MSEGDAQQPPPSRAAKSLKAIEGNDEFSNSANRDPRKPAMELKPKLEAVPVPPGVAPQSHEGNLLLRLLAKIFR